MPEGKISQNHAPPICVLGLANKGTFDVIVINHRVKYLRYCQTIKQFLFSPYLIRWSQVRHASWWRHQMKTFSAILAICAGNSLVPGEYSAQRPVTRSFDVLFYLHPNKRLSKQWLGWWFETPPCPLWRHRNDESLNQDILLQIRQWLADCSALSHCLNQCCLIISGMLNIFHWNLICVFNIRIWIYRYHRPCICMIWWYAINTK